MADIEAATRILRGLQREIVEGENGFIITYSNYSFFVSNQEIDEYIAWRPEISSSSETQVFMPGYYEHVVQFEGVRPRRYPRREENLILKSNDEKILVEVGRPSTNFVLYITDSDKLSRNIRRLFTSPFFIREEEHLSLQQLLRINTIKVRSDADSSVGKSSSKSHDLAEAATFHFAYGQGLAISFTKTWERTYYWLGKRELQEIQFPLRTYDSELIAYYNLALSTDSLVLGYLALYKILEYFFTSVSEETLHEKIKNQLILPDFSHTKPKKMRELVKIVRSFDNRFDELSSLKLVISRFFEPRELRSWIEDYEDENGVHFTENISIFNTKMIVDKGDNTIISNVATRIYSIRNALVHNKEGEVARFIPYTGQEESLIKEVKILLYLAENIIIKTGRDL